jgi:DNA polymerase I
MPRNSRPQSFLGRSPFEEVARSFLERFEEVWAHDFEFIALPGERPDVVCLVAHELRTGRTLKLWRDELGERPPYRTDDRVAFVNFSGQAEMACHLALGWPMPRNIIDLSAIFRHLTNGKATPDGKGLIGMLRYYGIDSISTKHKEAMRDRIIKGWPFTADEQKKILAYCSTDVLPMVQLLERVLPEIDLGVVLYWGQFIAASAAMQHRGVPIDMENYPLLASKTVWRAVRDEMVPIVDREYGVYVLNAAGDWIFSWDRWTAYLKREGIHDLWPCLASGKLDMRRKTFENMSRGFPQLEPLRQLRHTRDKMRRIKLAVGADGRNRTVLWSFKSKTGRTQPAAAEWIFSPAVWLRSLIKPTTGMAVAYIDYSSMEFLLAASLSDGHCGPVNKMLDMYKTGDPYLSFAKSVGAVPLSATKKSHGEVRDKYKVMLLSTQYGLSAPSLAVRLKISEFEAQEMLNQHREQFAQYWQYSDDYIQHAMQTGYVRTAMGWGYHIGIVGIVNERSLRNWPIQSGGADILRIACILAERHGIRLLAPVHDAVLIEAPVERIEADATLMREIMRRASRIVLNATATGTHELRTDQTIVRFPDRYTDPRGDEIWAHVAQIIAGHRPTQEEKRA